MVQPLQIPGFPSITWDDLAPGQAESHLFSPGRSPKGSFRRKSRSIDTSENW